jgi:stalled ribosome rescue protein Dom34
MKGSRVQEETMLIQSFFEHVSKDDGLAVYGTGEVKKAVDFGAVETLLVSDTLISRYREKGNFSELDQLMKDAEKNKARIRIISDEHEAGERFSKMEIAALLRFKIG